MSGADYTRLERLFTAELLHRISRFELRPFRTVRTNRQGGHRSRNVGANIEYAEHREYVPGDDIRRIDWKAFARQDRISIKLQEEEESLPVDIFVDVSGSMRFPERGFSKLDTALFSALGTAYLFHSKKDRVRVHLLNDRLIPWSKPAATGFEDFKTILGEIPHAAASAFAETFSQVADFVLPGSLVIIFSDAIADEEEFIRGIRMLCSPDRTVVFCHVMSREELSLSDTRSVNYLDCESDSRIETDPISIRDKYARRIEQFRVEIETSLRNAAIDYSLLLAETPPVSTLFHVLNRFTYV